MAIRYINICTIENKAIMNIIIIESENILAFLLGMITTDFVAVKTACFY